MDITLYTVAWDITGRCNLNCIHCGSPSKSDPNELSTKEGRELIDSAYELGCKNFIFTGGEPLFRKDLFELIRYARNKGLRVLVPSNGVLLDRDTAFELKKAGLTKSIISLDGPKKIHDKIRGKKGVYEKAVRAIKNLKEVRIPVTMKLTVMQENVKYYRYLLDLAEELGVGEFALKRYVPAGVKKYNKDKLAIPPGIYEKIVIESWEIANEKGIKMMSRDPVVIPKIFYEKIIEKYKDPNNILAGCLAGIAMCHVNNVGNVSPCAFIPITTGNIRLQNLKDIWRTSYLFKKLRDRANLRGKCGKCNFVNLCGGCRASALTFKGDIFAEDPYCLMGRGHK